MDETADADIVDNVDNKEKFKGKAGVYEKYRPGYPEVLLDALTKACGLKAGSPVADIGSGTGKLAGALLGRGLRVWAVEPNADMRAQAERRFAQSPDFHSVAGAAERTGLPEKSVELVTAAQAFHWFDHAAFRAECARILKPGAKAALIWNSREPSAALTRASAQAYRRFCPAFRGFSGGMGEETDAFRAFFRGGVYETLVFPNDLEMDRETFVGRSLSASYAPRPGDASYAAFSEAMDALFAQFAQNGRVLFPNSTRCYLGEV